MSHDYLAAARAAARRWREAQGLPVEETPLNPLSPLFAQEEIEKDTAGVSTGKHTISREENARKASKARKDTFSPSPLPSADSVHYLRLVVRRWFTLAVAEADGQLPPSAEANALYQELVRLQDETGPAFADALIREEHRRFRAETARCGWCGGPGHDSECTG